MKYNLYPGEKALFFYIALLILLPAAGLRAQICQDPTDTVYGLSSTGVIYPLNVNNATVGAGLDSLTDGNTPSNANGIGYSTLNHRFYYFERSGAGAPNQQRFVYYDITTTPPTVLGRAAPPFAAANRCRSGCVNTAGNGYYTIDPSVPSLYYFNVLTNTWTVITNVFLNQSSANVSSTFSALLSGDMAFDASGNLWILCSGATQYGLYEISAPVPTTAVASITATQIISPTSNTPGGVAFTGMAFVPSGAAYLTTGPGDNKLYKLSSLAQGPQYIGTFPKNDVAGDITSCVFPIVTLPASVYTDFDAVLRENVELSWTCTEDVTVGGYRVEHSTDGLQWNGINSQQRNAFSKGSSSTYSYIDKHYAAGDNFYRIVQVTQDGKETFSVIKVVNGKTDRKIYLGPNPASDLLYVYNRNAAARYLAQVFDYEGRLMYYSILSPGDQSINIGRLQKGNYILKLTSSLDASIVSTPFMKW